MTLEEKVIATAYTGISFVQGAEIDDFFQYVSKKLGRPVFIHEDFWKELKEKSKSDFINMCSKSAETSEK